MPNDKPSKTYARPPPSLAKLSHPVARVALYHKSLINPPHIILLPPLRLAPGG